MRAVPELRSPGAARTLNQGLAQCDYDLEEWRATKAGRGCPLHPWEYIQYVPPLGASSCSCWQMRAPSKPAQFPVTTSCLFWRACWSSRVGNLKAWLLCVKRACRSRVGS